MTDMSQEDLKELAGKLSEFLGEFGGAAPASFEETLAQVDEADSEAGVAMLNWLLKTGRLGRVGVLDNGGGYLFMYEEPKGSTKAGYRPGATAGDRIVDKAVEEQRASGATPVVKGMCVHCFSIVKDVDGVLMMDDATERVECVGPDSKHVLA